MLDLSEKQEQKYQGAKPYPEKPRDQPGPGEYTCEIMSAVLKPTKAGTGEYLELRLDLWAPGGAYAGANWTRLNTKNPSQKAVEYGHKKLKAILEACGLPMKLDEKSMVGKKFVGDFELKDSPQYGPSIELVEIKQADDIPF